MADFTLLLDLASGDPRPAGHLPRQRYGPARLHGRPDPAGAAALERRFAAASGG